MNARALGIAALCGLVIAALVAIVCTFAAFYPGGPR